METLGNLGKALATYCEPEDLRPSELSHPEERVRVMVFKDQDGYVQVIHKTEDMLDVEMLNLDLGRDLRPVTLRRQRDIRTRLGTDVLVPIPVKKGKWETVLDLNVLDLETVEIPTGPESGVEIPKTTLLKVLDQPHRISVTKNVEKTLFARCADGDTEACIREFTRLKIRKRLDATIELPPLSSSARRLMQLRTNPNANLNDLVEIIEMDASLTANILRWAGSSFYSHAGEIASVKDAIGRVMGFDLVLNLAMGLTLGGSIGKPDDHPDGFMDYWHQSVWMAYAAATVAGAIPARYRPSYGMVYLTGLLHNFGYLVLNHTFPPYFKMACRHWEANRHLDTNIVEVKLFGITREQIASELFQCWEMPEELTVTIREQKTADYDGPYSEYVNILKASRCLLDDLGFPAGVEIDKSTPFLEKLKVDKDLLEVRMERLIEKRKQIDDMASLL